jgi:TP901 family phage tail tape measure protein
MAEDRIDFGELFEENLAQKISKVNNEVNELAGNLKKLGGAMAEPVKIVSKDQVETLKSLASTSTQFGKILQEQSKQLVEVKARSEELNAQRKVSKKLVDDELAGINTLKKLIKDLNDQYKTLNPNLKSNAQQIQNIKDKLSIYNTELTRQSTALKKANNDIKFAAKSYQELNKKLTDARSKLRQLPDAINKSTGAWNTNNIAVQKQLALVRQLDGRLKGLDKSIGVNFRNVGNYSSAFTGLRGSVGGLLGAFGVAGGGALILGEGLRQSFKESVALSDVQADLQKNTNLTAREVDVLREAFEKLPTRTSTQDLLKLAIVAGKLGIEGAANIKAFAESADDLVIALSDDLGSSADEVVRTISKTTSVLGVAKLGSDEFAEGLLRVGSAINEVTKNSAASAQAVIDFTNRVGSVANTVGISAPEIIGLGGAISALGISSELAGTAIQRFLIDIVRPESAMKFSKLLNMPIDDFKANLKDKPFDVFKDILAEIGKTGEKDVGKLVGVLDALDIKQQRAITSLSRLATNQELMNTVVDSSIAGYNDLGKIQVEVDAKQGTLAASADRVSKAWKALITGGAIQGFFSGVLEAIKLTITSVDVLLEKLRQSARFVAGLSAISSEEFSLKVAAAQLKTLENAKDEVSTLKKTSFAIKDKAKQLSKIQEVTKTYEANLERLNKAQGKDRDASLDQRLRLEQLIPLLKKFATEVELSAIAIDTIGDEDAGILDPENKYDQYIKDTTFQAASLTEQLKLLKERQSELITEGFLDEDNFGEAVKVYKDIARIQKEIDKNNKDLEDAEKKRVAAINSFVEGQFFESLELETRISNLKASIKSLALDITKLTPEQLKELKAKTSLLEKLEKENELLEEKKKLREELQEYAQSDIDFSEKALSVALEAIQTEIDALQNKAILQEDESEKLIKLKEEEAKILQAINDETTKDGIAKNKELFNGIFFAIGQLTDIFAMSLDGSLIKVDNELSALKDKEERLLEIYEGNAEAQDRVRRNTEQEEDRLEKKRVEILTKKAKLDKAAAMTAIIQNTAVEVSKVLSIPPLAIAIGLFGAAQLAVVANQPIPKFEKGTDNSPEGVAIVGEKGRELIIPSKGDAYVSPDRETKTYLPKGSKVIPNQKTENILSNMSASLEIPNSLKREDNSEAIERLITKRDAEILAALEGRKEYVFNVSKQGVEMLRKKGDNTTKYYNERYND